MNSSTTWPLTPPRSEIAVRSTSAPGMAHSCSRCPPSPSPLPGPSFGPAMNPSRDMDMSRTVADIASPFLVCGLARISLPQRGDSFLSRRARAVASGSPPVGEREVVTVSLVVLLQLPDAGESRAVVAELCAAALSEPRGIASQCQLSAVEPDSVDPMDAARVEVLHREVVLALHHADHAERVGKAGVLVDCTLDQEPVTFEPLVGGPPANHRVFDHQVGHLARPLADQCLERLQLRTGVGLVHSTPSFAFSRDIALSLPAIGCPLVDQHEHAVADDLRLLQLQVASLGLLLESLLAHPEDHGEDHQIDLVDEVALDQLLHQSVTPRHLQLAVELLLQLAHLGRRVAAVEDCRVVPLRVLERRRDDELRHRVELVGELALTLGPGAGEALIGSQPYQQGVGLPRLVQLEPIPVVSAVELEGPIRVLESWLAPRRLHDAVERYELRHHDPCCHQSISFTPTGRLQTPADHLPRRS